jgi:hypothetical protein
MAIVEGMWLRRFGEMILTLLLRVVIVLVLVALALGVLLLGIAVMLKEPQGIVAFGTLGVSGALLFFAFHLVFGGKGDEESEQPESTAGP